MKTMRLLGKL